MKLSGRWPRYLILLALLVLGAGLIAGSHYAPWKWAQDLISGLGEALAVFVFLTFTVEKWFREDFAKDAFLAGLGASLPVAFHDELRWLTTFEWLAVETRIKVQVQDLGEVVSFTMTIERLIENITDATLKRDGLIAIDDWGIAGYKPVIKQCAIQKGTQPPLMAGEPEIKDSHWKAKTKAVDIKPGERVKTFSKTVEYMHRNDINVLALTAPSKDPQVEFEISPTLQGHAGFTHRGKMEDEFFAKRTLRGTYLPGQMLVVRWWPRVKHADGPIATERG